MRRAAATLAMFLWPAAAMAQVLTAPQIGAPDRGRSLVTQKGCGGCHTIPGVDNADGMVGPPLTMMGRRIFIAGMLHNSAENLAAWVLDPQRYVPGNAMPATGLTPQEAADVAVFLETLR